MQQYLNTCGLGVCFLGAMLTDHPVNPLSSGIPFGVTHNPHRKVRCFLGVYYVCMGDMG